LRRPGQQAHKRDVPVPFPLWNGYLRAVSVSTLPSSATLTGAEPWLVLPAALAARGIRLRPNASENSGLHGAIWRQGPDGAWAWDGAADDRREGVARVE
jgi:hypothetical protein